MLLIDDLDCPIRRIRWQMIECIGLLPKAARNITKPVFPTLHSGSIQPFRWIWGVCRTMESDYSHQLFRAQDVVRLSPGRFQYRARGNKRANQVGVRTKVVYLLCN